ncbi:MAG TPA: hypothetical protein EYP08_03565, partial [Pyrodictiaceae archaeon]|nr:hypothetical protein [Pyrodictiaceae archaeon]
ELMEYDRALELMEKAEEILEELGREEDVLHIRIYKAYITFENGDIPKAKAELASVLPKVLDKPQLKAQVHLVFEEIFEEQDNYEAALQECLYAMIEAKEGEYFDIAFDALIDVIWQLMIEDEFEIIYNNIDMFANAIPELKDFFEGVKAIALFKDGKVGREEVSEAVLKVKDRRLLDLLEFLAEAEL